MTVKIRLFAMLRERAGAESIELELDDGATVSDLLRILRERGPLSDLIGRMPVVMAVNRDYATPATPLHPDDELALIPPVSGGGGFVHVRVREDPLSPDELVRSVGSPAAGAIVMFCGITRQVERLDYEAYSEMAEARMKVIVSDCAERHGLQAAAAEHRVGEVTLGEPSVAVAVSAPHRAEAFAGAREAIDRIKAEVPIWKREPAPDGSMRWVDGAARRPESNGANREGVENPSATPAPERG